MTWFGEQRLENSYDPGVENGEHEPPPSLEHDPPTQVENGDVDPLPPQKAPKTWNFL